MSGYVNVLLMYSVIDDLRKSRGLHSVSAYRHGLYIYRSRPAGLVIVQELRESKGGRLELSVLTSLLVSVDVKNY